MKHQLLKSALGTLCSMNFNVLWLRREVIVEDSLSSSILFKYNGSLQCIALWISSKILYLILAYTCKMCRSMQIGVILSLDNLGRPTTNLAALLINNWRRFRMTFGMPYYKELQNSIIENTSPWTNFIFALWKILIKLTITFLSTLLFCAFKLNWLSNTKSRFRTLLES